MGTINPRARGDASLSGDRRQLRKDLEQQRRQRVVLPKPLPPVVAAPATGGGSFGIIGTTKAFADSYTVDGLRGIEFIGWTFIENDWPGGGGPSCVALSPTSPEFNVVQPGWYMTHAQITFIISGSGGQPPFLDLELNGRSTSNTDANATERVSLVAEGSSWTAYRRLSSGHFYHPGGSSVSNFLNVAVTYPSTAGVVVEDASCRYVVARVF